MGQVMSCHDMLMPAVIETCTCLKLPMQILDNSANYGLMRMTDDRVDNVDDFAVRTCHLECDHDCDYDYADDHDHDYDYDHDYEYDHDYDYDYEYDNLCNMSLS